MLMLSEMQIADNTRQQCHFRCCDRRHESIITLAM